MTSIVKIGLDVVAAVFDQHLAGETRGSIGHGTLSLRHRQLQRTKVLASQLDVVINQVVVVKIPAVVAEELTDQRIAIISNND